MIINPDDRRLGPRRQQITRAQIDGVLDEIARQRRARQRGVAAASSGIGRRVRAIPIRGHGSRPFAGGVPARLGGLAQFLQDRGPGKGAEMRQYFEPGAFAPSRIPTPPPHAGLPGDPFTDRMSPVALDQLRDLMAPSTRAQNPLLDSLMPASPGLRRWEGTLNQDALNALIGGGPQTLQSPTLSDFGGLVPLGGGTWYDPNTGVLHGGGGRAMF